MDMKNKIFVIIVTYKGRRWYDDCFQSLLKSTLPVQMIVVDNTPDGEDAMYIKENYPMIHLIKTTDNMGFGKANNLAMRYAYDHGCDYVFLLNQDTWLLKDDTIEQLVKIAEHHPEYGILSPMHLSADRTYLNMDYEYERGLCARQLVNDLYCDTLKDIYETDYVNAAAWLLPRRTLETVGGFDPLFTQYAEDDDYIHRVRYHGLKIGLCPQQAIIHDHTLENWSEEGKMHFMKANEDHLELLLDINKEYSYCGLQRQNLNRLIKAICAGDKSSVQRIRRRMKYIYRNNRAIKEHRNINSQKGLTWL